MSKDLERIRKYAYRHIKNFDVYIDIGALDGDTSTSLIGDFKRIICFEPNPNEFSKLSDKVEKYNVALSDREGLTELVLPNGKKKPGHGSINRFSKGGISEGAGGDRIIFKDIPVKKLDSYNISDVSFIKIDTEGSELQILKGSVNTIKKYKPVLFFEAKQLDQKPSKEFVSSMNLNYKFIPVDGDNIVAYVKDE